MPAVLCNTPVSPSVQEVEGIYWLPVRSRIEFKLPTYYHQHLHSETMPSYLCGLLTSYTPSTTVRSQDASLLVVPHFDQSLEPLSLKAKGHLDVNLSSSVPRFSISSYGGESFSVFGPITLIFLPLNIRQTSCLATFKALKTRLFNAYLL